MIKFYWNVITGLEFYIIEKEVNLKSKKRKRAVNKKSTKPIDGGTSYKDLIKLKQ